MPRKWDVCVSERNDENKMGKEKIKNYVILLLVLLPVWGSQMCYTEAAASYACMSVL